MSAIVFIPLTQGKVAVIDFEDFEKVRHYKWHAGKRRHTWYAFHRVGKRGICLAMHRVILNAPYGKDVDHKDGDGLNNQRYNIRVCSQIQNSQASCRKATNSTSRFRGVSRDRTRNLWISQLSNAGQPFYLGRFSKEEDAARAYDKKAIELFGEYASPNFPKQTAKD